MAEAEAPSRPIPLRISEPLRSSSSSNEAGGVTVRVRAEALTEISSHPEGWEETLKLLRFEAEKWTVTGAVSPSVKKMAGESKASEPFTSSSPHEMKRAAARAQIHPANRFIDIVYLLNFNSKNRCKDTKKRDKSYYRPVDFCIVPDPAVQKAGLPSSRSLSGPRRLFFNETEERIVCRR